MLVNNGGEPGIGRTQPPAAGLDGAHLGNLQMLIGTDTGAEPGVVGDIGHHGGAWYGMAQLIAKHVFKTNVQGQMLAGDCQRRL